MKRSDFLSPSAAPKSSAEWFDYYVINAQSQLDVPWERGAQLTAQDIESIGKSLQAWQLGETSDGSHLMQSAQKYARRIDDAQFTQAVELFIREEQRHGGDLGHFLDLAGIPRARKNWGDSCFRAIRYFLLNMEIWATSVVMVETIALIYYKAIRQATDSAVLRQICKQILRDEVMHIRFQCERLAILHRHRPYWLRLLTYGVQRLLFFGIVIAVWLGHHRALQAGRFTFGQFWQTAWAKMSYAWQQMRPERYVWEGQAPQATANKVIANNAQRNRLA